MAQPQTIPSPVARHQEVRGESVTLDLRQLLEAVPWTRAIAVTFLVMARLGPVVFVTPFLGGRRLPGSARLVVVAVLTLAMWPSGWVASVDLPEAWPWVTLLVMKEGLVGMVLALMVTVLFSAIEAGGRLMDTTRGAQMAQVLTGPVGGSQLSPGGPAPAFCRGDVLGPGRPPPGPLGAGEELRHHPVGGLAWEGGVDGCGSAGHTPRGRVFSRGAGAGGASDGHGVYFRGLLGVGRASGTADAGVFHRAAFERLGGRFAPVSSAALGVGLVARRVRNVHPGILSSGAGLRGLRAEIGWPSGRHGNW